jgi:hypothetical protein
MRLVLIVPGGKKPYAWQPLTTLFITDTTIVKGAMISWQAKRYSRARQVADCVASECHGKELLGHICVGTFWGRIYWARSIHGETPTLALETNGEDRRENAVEEAHEVAKSCALKHRSRIPGLCLQDAGLAGDGCGSEKEEKAYHGWTVPWHL